MAVKLRVLGLDYGGGYDLLRALPAFVGSKWLFWHSDGQPYRNLSSRFAMMVQNVFLTAYDAKHGTTAKDRRPLQELVQAQRNRDWMDIGFRTFRFHDLRHLHAVEYVRAGGSLYDLQDRLGHESITTTEGYRKFFYPGGMTRGKVRDGDTKRTQQPKLVG